MKKISELFLKARGWTFVGEAPAVSKAVAVGYPHTTNWDFFIFLAVSAHFGMKFSFLAHEGLFVGPVGWLLRQLGGIPVQGGSSGTIVEAAVRSFGSADRMYLAIAPEGTRAAADHWRSGFWRIADAAGVPVAMAFVDWPSKTTGFGPTLPIDGDPEAWMEQAAVFYADKQGLKPHHRGAVRLAD